MSQAGASFRSRTLARVPQDLRQTRGVGKRHQQSRPRFDAPGPSSSIAQGLARQHAEESLQNQRQTGQNPHVVLRFGRSLSPFRKRHGAGFVRGAGRRVVYRRDSGRAYRRTSVRPRVVGKRHHPRRPRFDAPGPSGSIAAGLPRQRAEEGLQNQRQRGQTPHLDLQFERSLSPFWMAPVLESFLSQAGASFRSGTLARGSCVPDSTRRAPGGRLHQV